MIYNFMTFPHAKPLIKKKELREVEKMYESHKNYVEYINKTRLEAEERQFAISFIQDYF